MPDITWVDPSGLEHPLTSGSVIVERGAQALLMPPVHLSDEVVPGQPGSRLRTIRHTSREVALPILVQGGSATAIRDAMRDWSSRFDPARGDGMLRVHTGAAARELECRYAGGMEQADEGIPGSRRFVAVFRAFDPYWYDTADRVQTFTAGGTATFFPFFPLRLSSSEVYADATVDNGGDVEAWPVWTITGPGVNPVLRNLTTGKNLSVIYTLTAGQTITVDTRPGVKTVTLDDGTNLFGRLSSTSSLWPLARGSNSVRVELTAATAESDVTLTYRRRYLSA